MVAVAVGDEDQVELADRVEIFPGRGRLGIAEDPGIDHDDLPGRGGDPHRRLAEPQDLDLALRGGLARKQRERGDEDCEQPPHDFLLCERNSSDDSKFYNASNVAIPLQDVLAGGSLRARRVSSAQVP